MAENDSDFIDELSRVLVNVNFSLKDEQRTALRHLFYGRDVLAILPTGFGKSLIFQLLVLLKIRSTILVICPLRSIIDDQLKYFGITATSLSEASFEALKARSISGKTRNVGSTYNNILFCANIFAFCHPIKKGYARLQAMYRAKVTSAKYRALRDRVRVFQAYCRGYLARQDYNKRMRSIVKIQSGMRKVLAKKTVDRLRVEKAKREEAERLRILEEKRLSKTQAEKLHRVSNKVS